MYITPRKVYIVTELVSGGELLDRWGTGLGRFLWWWISRVQVSANDIHEKILEGIVAAHRLVSAQLPSLFALFIILC